MKIVIDARESGTTSGRYVDKLLEYLQKIDHQHEYYVLLKTHRLEIYRNIPQNFHIIECNIKEFTFSEQIVLAWQIKKLSPDLVHFPMVQQPLLYLGKTVTTMQDLTTLRFRNPSKNPVVFWLKQRVYWIVNYIVPRKSEHIISISLYSKQDVIKTMRYNRPEKFTVTLESADELPNPSVSVELLEGKMYIMYVGRHQPHKNLSRLMDAHQMLLSKYPDLHLVIVGRVDATTQPLQQRIADANYKNIMFTDFVSDNQLRWLYENTTCYTFPSLSEGFGLPGLEAMIHGAPVASSNATCLPEIYGDGAHYFDPLNVEDIASKIEDILSDNSLRADLIAKGRIQASKYSWQRMAEQTLEIYQQALNK